MVIALFPWIKAGLVLCFLLPMIGLGVYQLYARNWELGFWLFLVTTPLFACYAFALLYELVFHGARAMWVENGQLVFVPNGLPASLTSYLYRAPVNAIASVSIGRLYTGGPIRPRGIFVDRKDRGFNRPFGQAPAHLYSEPVEVVHARLCQTLGIKAVPAVTPVGAPAVSDNSVKN